MSEAMLTDVFVLRGLSLLAAFGLDWLLGDPQTFPHPVRFIGKMVAWGTKACRACPLPLRLSGAVMALTLISIVGGGLYALSVLCWQTGVAAWLAVETLLIYFAIAPRCLAFEARRIREPLRGGDLATARQRLAMIVGRDTEGLNESEIARATVETVAENYVDGVLCPMFFAAVGGAVGAWVYKAISTLDSMVGYRHGDFAELGWAGARMDDAAAFAPARLALAIVPVAAIISRLDARECLRTGWADGRNHPSPNAGFGEALFAGALRVRLGGRSAYSGRASEKPFLGERFHPPSADSIQEAVRLMWASAVVFVAAAVAALCVVGLA